MFDSFGLVQSVRVPPHRWGIPLTELFTGLTNLLSSLWSLTRLLHQISSVFLPFIFLDFFASKIETTSHSLDTDSISLPTCNDSQFLVHPHTAVHPVSVATVKNIIMQSSISTCELDPLQASFINQYLDTLLPYISTTVNNALTVVKNSLLFGSFPESFKICYRSSSSFSGS